MEYRKQQQHARDLKRAWLDSDTEVEFNEYYENREITESYIESLMNETSEEF